ncbi:MAG: hypothetical protein JNL26_03755, partial [Gemmatimonadetes bacterium]|nr:hypothetical protein [Gemmatimonadota bacterium]
MLRSLTIAMVGAAVAIAPINANAQAHAMSHGTASSTLRATLRTLLQEHAFLAANATGAALGGRKAEFESAAAALDMNSVDVSKAIGSV